MAPLQANPYYKAGMAINTARTYGPAAFNAGKRIYGAYSNYKRKKRRKTQHPRKNIGFPVGTATSRKRDFNDLGAALKAERALHIFNLSALPTTSANALASRERDLANFIGVKVCMEVRNIRDVPLYFNWAIISPKKNTTVPTANFFRGGDDDRSKDFGVAMNSLQFHCTPINSDLYEVLHHKRYLIGKQLSSEAFNDTNEPNFMNLDQYVKINRQIRYNSDSADPIADNIFLVYWFAGWGDGSTHVPVSSAAAVTLRTVTYFKDPKN